MIPRFSPPESHISAPREHSANTTSKEKISQILIFKGGKESKMRILDILLQRILEYAKEFKSKTDTYLGLSIGMGHYVVE